MVAEKEGERGRKWERKGRGEGEGEEGERAGLKRSKLRPFLRSPPLLDSSILIPPLLIVGHPPSQQEPQTPFLL